MSGSFDRHVVTIAVQSPDGDESESGDANYQLRRELLELDVDDVVVQSAVPPDDAKAGGAGAIVGLAVQLASSPAALKAVVSAVCSWLSRQRSRTVSISLDGDTLNVTGVSSAEQQSLIDAWIARHADH
jgi:hypothetical protein